MPAITLSTVRPWKACTVDAQAWSRWRNCGSSRPSSSFFASSSRNVTLSNGFQYWVCRDLDAVSGLWTPDTGEWRPDRQSEGLPAPDAGMRRSDVPSIRLVATVRRPRHRD